MATPDKGKSPVSLGPLEDEIMRIVWSRDQATVRDVQEELQRRGTSLAYTTVMTVMARLATKRLLSRRRSGRSFVYKARVTHDQFRENTARSLAQRLVEGFDRLGIASFVQEVAKVGPDQLRELQDLASQATARNDRPN